MNNTTDLLFDVYPGTGGNLGIITLNRPKALNSLNHGMIKAMQSQLDVWAATDEIKAVIIHSVLGRAFCAGGDIREAYHRMVAQDPKSVDFFRDEYTLNRSIFHYPKPYIALLNGITMGGGVGISIHGSHRVATERLVFAMPETGIGFYPDVGGTYFLPRLSGYLGVYLGLTGVKLSGDECVALGITQQKVASDSLPTIIESLARQPFEKDAKQSVTELLNQFKIAVGPSMLLQEQAKIDRHFCAPTMEEIMVSLLKSKDKQSQALYNDLNKKSPTSLKVSLRAMQEAKHMDFNACMRQEFRLTAHFVQGHDFVEGIRALIIEKDNSPRWRPSSLDEVTFKAVDEYFAPLEKELI